MEEESKKKTTLAGVALASGSVSAASTSAILNSVENKGQEQVDDKENDVISQDGPGQPVTQPVQPESTEPQPIEPEPVIVDPILVVEPGPTPDDDIEPEPIDDMYMGPVDPESDPDIDPIIIDDVMYGGPIDDDLLELMYGGPLDDIDRDDADPYIDDEAYDPGDGDLEQDEDPEQHDLLSDADI